MLKELVKNDWFGLGIVLSESTFKVFYKRKMQNGLVLCQEVTKLFNRIARFTSIPFICYLHQSALELLKLDIYIL